VDKFHVAQEFGVERVVEIAFRVAATGPFPRQAKIKLQVIQVSGLDQSSQTTGLGSPGDVDSR
jgi:hypothetical protein